jgi:hypothetical protein
MGVVILAWVTSPNPAATQDDGDPFTGRWLINGEDPFGTEYSGSLTIQAKDGGYQLDWIITGALLTGSGRTSGDTLTAEWNGTIAGTDVVGTAAYTVDRDAIAGVTMIAGVDGEGAESGELAR